FVLPIRKIVAHLPKERQNLFFSATMPSEIGKLAAELLKSPEKVSVAPQSTTVEKVEQTLFFVEAQRKRALLAELFAERALSRVIVFTRTKRGADRLAKFLDVAGVGVAAIHGDKSQGQRERALAAFKAGACRAMVATDIAARGIDVDGVTHVINYELPNVPEAYVHRIGRTARAGATGVAISLCCDDERNLLKDIQRTTRQTIPSFDRRNDKVLAQATAVADALVPKDAGREDPVNPQQRGRGGDSNRPQRSHGRNQGHPAAHGRPGGQGAGQAQGRGEASGRGRGPSRSPGRSNGGGHSPKAITSGSWSPIDS
ncbi:MAG: box helicase domain protein, partial [Caulobacteraceae bacterium]|nr:box helicase domain protein [Caulobacteraceae bacterium]